jgi:PAS domain S-box-containing protein
MERDKKKYHILIAEDNLGDYSLIYEYLEEQIVAPVIERAISFKEIKSLLETDIHRYDVILLDLSLPDKDGENLINEVMALCIDCPVIVLTGYSDSTFGVKSLSMGISDYLLKDELTASSLYKSIIYNIERKRTISELEESEKKYTELFQSSPLPMWVYEIETLKFLDVNKAAIKSYGYTYEEFLGMTIKDIRPVDDLGIFEEKLALSRKSPQDFFRARFRHQKKNGEIIQVDVQSDNFLFNKLPSRIVLAIDVTKQQDYIGAIEVQNEKLREIGWIQSHVVRAPLSRIMGLVVLLKDEQCDENEKKEILGYILDSANELDGIIRDIANKAHNIELEIKRNEM